MKHQFQPGNKGGGRKPGSKNRKPTIQALIEKLWHIKYQDLSHEYDYMTAGQKLKFWEIMLPFASPKLQASAIQTKYDSLKKEDAKMLVEELRKRVIQADKLDYAETINVIPDEKG
jgi:hypothetical protein